MTPLPLRAALKRGALVTAANWPVVLIDFTVECVYKLALAVPVIGGAIMAATVLGGDLQSMVDGGVQQAAEIVLASLGAAPSSLISFLVALAIVGIGGACLMFTIKAGTLALLVAGERRAGDLHERAVDASSARRASAFGLRQLIDAATRFAARACKLGVALGLSYLVLGLAFLLVARTGLSLAAHWNPGPVWPLAVLAVTAATLVGLAVINLTYDLVRLVVVTEDCDIVPALGRVRAFVVTDARQVMGILAIMGAIVLLATVVTLLAAAGLTVAAWVPLIGVVIVPLQAAVWAVRGLLFQYMSLATLTACQAQYQRFAGRP